jgi:uncharacterized Zn-finger protein
LIVSRQSVSSTPYTVNRAPFGAHQTFWWSMAPFETIYTDEMVAACDGGEGPLGHPRVYLNLSPAGKIECPYCSRLFVNRAASARSGDENPLSGEPGQRHA